MMRKNYFFALLVMLLASVRGGAQPYAPGVAEHLTNAIHSSDPSAFKKVEYDGRGERTVFDRRVGHNITFNAFLFTVTWDNGGTADIIINPEVGGKKYAREQAIKHARIVGRLPFCLRTLINQIKIHGGNAPYGGGNHGILFYTQKTVEHERDGDLDEIAVHEAAHNLGNEIADTQLWKTAQNRDDAFISVYARKHPTREDVSESFLAWLILRYHKDRISAQDEQTIKNQIPARLRYFDNQNYNVSPVAR